MTAVQPSKVDMCRLLSDQPVGAIEYINKEVNVKEFDWDYWQLHRCEKTTLVPMAMQCTMMDFVATICHYLQPLEIEILFSLVSYFKF